MARRTCVSLLTSSEPQPLPSQGPRVLARPPLAPPRKELGGGHLLSQSKQTLSFEAEMAQDGSRLGRVFTAPSGGARLSQDFDHHGPPRSEMRPCI